MTAAALLLLLAAAAPAQELDTLYLLPGSTETLAVPLVTKGGTLEDALLEVEGPKTLRLVEGSDLGPRAAGEEGAMFRVALQAPPAAKPGEWSFELRARRLTGSGALWRRRIKVVVFAPGPGAARAKALPAAPGVKCWDLGPSRVCAPDARAILRHHARRVTGDLAQAARLLKAMEERAAARVGVVDAYDLFGALGEGYGQVLSSMSALGKLSPEALAAVAEELRREGLTAESARAGRRRAAARRSELERRYPVLPRPEATFEQLMAVERAAEPEASTAALVVKLMRQGARLAVTLEAISALPEAGGDPAESARVLMDYAFPPGPGATAVAGPEQVWALEALPRLSTAAAAEVPRLAALLSPQAPGQSFVERALIGIGTPEAWEAVEGFERDFFHAASAVPGSGWQGYASGLKDRGAVAVRSDADWKAFWERHRPGRPAPELDFAREMAVGVFLGDGLPREARLESVERSTAAVTAVFAWTGPRDPRAAPAAFCLARLPATPLPVRVIERWRPDERAPWRETVLYESPAR